MTSIQNLIEYVASPKYSDQQLVSTDRSILSRRQVEIIPREASTFGQQSANNVAYNGTLSQRLTFHLSDPRHYIDFKNSYFHCDFKCNGSSAAGGDVGAFLDNGGIHSLIRSVIVRHGSAELLRIENYNKLYNAMTLPKLSPEQRDGMLGDALDSYQDQYEEKNYPVGLQMADAITGNVPNAATVYDDAGGAHEKILTVNGGDLLSEVSPGDILLITVAADSYYVKVVTVHTDEIMTVDGLPAADIGAGLILTITRVKQAAFGQVKSGRRNAVQSGANAAAITDTHKCAFQIPLGIFEQEHYFPLPFLNSSLEITLEMEYPHLGLVVPLGFGDTTNLLGYSITSPRLVAMMIEPSASVFEAHRRLWKDDGLVYRVDGVRSYEHQFNSGTQFNVSFQTNIKSLKKALSVMVDQTAAMSTVDNAAGQELASQSAFNKKDMSSYRFKVGGLSFPDYGSVNVDNVGSAEAWRQLKLVLGDDEMRTGSSIPNWKWRETDSDKFIASMLFSKEGDVYNCGVDVSNNYLEMEVVLGTAIVSGTDDQTNITFLMYDQALVISEKNQVRLYY